MNPTDCAILAAIIATYFVGKCLFILRKKSIREKRQSAIDARLAAIIRKISRYRPSPSFKECLGKLQIESTAPKPLPEMPVPEVVCHFMDFLCPIEKESCQEADGVAHLYDNPMTGKEIAMKLAKPMMDDILTEEEQMEAIQSAIDSARVSGLAVSGSFIDIHVNRARLEKLKSGRWAIQTSERMVLQDEDGLYYEEGGRTIRIRPSAGGSFLIFSILPGFFSKHPPSLDPEG